MYFSRFLWISCHLHLYQTCKGTYITSTIKAFKVMKHLLKKVSSFYNSFILICSDKWRLKRWEQGGINQGQFLKVLHVNQFNSNEFVCTCWHISWRKTHTIFFSLWRTSLNLCIPYPMQLDEITIEEPHRNHNTWIF